MVIYYAGFIEIFRSELIMIGFFLLGIGLFIHSIKSGPRRKGKHMNPALYDEYKKPTIDKWRIILFSFLIMLCLMFIFLISYFFYLDYSNGIKTLVFKVASKEIKIKKHKRRRSLRSRTYYEYELKAEQYPGMTFQVTKKTFEQVRIKKCYEIKYYGKLTYYFRVKHIKQIKELPNCNK